MDKDLIEFFGRAKRISLLPQDRKNIWEELVTERKHVSERHKKCMKMPSNIMHITSAIGLSSKEKKHIRNELQAFMRRHTPKKDKPATYWSPQSFISIYIPVLAVTLIILVNTRQWKEGSPFIKQSEQLIPIPLYEEKTATGEDGADVQDEDQNDTLERQQPSMNNGVSDPQPPEQDEAELMQRERDEEDPQIEPKGGGTPIPESAENEPDTTQIQQLKDTQEEDPIYQPELPFSKPMQIERVNEEDSQGEIKGETTPVPESTDNAPDTTTKGDTQPGDPLHQPAKSTDTTTDSDGDSGSASADITAAEERLESLRIKSMESEETIDLFDQAERMLQKAHTYPENSSYYVQGAESIMDQLDDIFDIK